MNEPLFPRRDPAEIAAELFRSCAWEEAGDPGGAAYKAAYYLFSESMKQIGPDHARLAFTHFATPPSARRMNAFKNKQLIERYKRMPEPNVMQLAEQIAEENKNLPGDERSGPRGSIHAASIEKHLRRLIGRQKARR